MPSRALIRRWFLRWASLLAHMVRHPWAHLRHRCEFKVIARPGLLGFGGGAFNPGAVRTAHGVVLIAKAQVQHWLHADADQYMRGSPVVLSLDDELRVRSVDEISRLEDLPTNASTEVEDFRLFTFAGEVWVNHHLIEVVRTQRKRGYLGSRVCLSRLDPVAKRLTFVGHPRIDFETKPREKNWVFVEHHGELFLLYSFRPYRILKLTDRQNLRFSTVLNKPIYVDFELIGGSSGYVSYSTNPIEYDDDHLLVLVHQSTRRTGGRYYVHWAVLLDRARLQPMSVTSVPLLSGVGARGDTRGILYVSSVLRIGENFVFFNGEGDGYVTRTVVSKARLERLWSSVAAVSKQPREAWTAHRAEPAADWAEDPLEDG